ncbi:arginase family protein [Desulfococcaceae bacterium HSG7]|nr:arginase family protein [Desulfococcaceae bacterium HSG7]
MLLRTAPIPRMAGHLSFMRAKCAEIKDLHTDSLAVLGAPLENNVGSKAGCRFAPLALRETSVYFGWHANPQFSHPIDIDVRERIDTSSIHSRLFDIGDIDLIGLDIGKAEEKIFHIMQAIRERGSSVILMGGDDSVVVPAISGLAEKDKIGYLQIGGRLPSVLYSAENGADKSGPPLTRLLTEGIVNISKYVVVAPSHHPSSEFVEAMSHNGGMILGHSDGKTITKNICEDIANHIALGVKSILVHLDLSAIDSPLHGMTNIPSFGGLSLTEMQNLLAAIGRKSVSGLILTGLNPTINGLSVVKTGQRLVVTALLGFIYSKFGLSISPR